MLIVLSALLLAETVVLWYLPVVIVTSNIGYMLLIWLAIIVYIGAMSVRFVVWSLLGKEVITLENGVLTKEMRGLLFSKPKQYDMQYITEFCVNDVDMKGLYWLQGPGVPGNSETGSIVFEYGMQYVYLARTLDYPEALELAEQMNNWLNGADAHTLPIQQDNP